MFLYTIALGYPTLPSPDEKIAARNFLLSLQHLLPCDKCRVNYRDKMSSSFGARLDAAVACNDTLMQYIYDMEASVAATNGAKIRSYTDTRQALLNNSYIRRDNVLAAGATPTTYKPAPAFYIVLPVAVVVAVVVTWVITRAVLKKCR